MLDSRRQETLERGRHHLRKICLRDRTRMFGEKTRILGAVDRVGLEGTPEEVEEVVAVVMEGASILVIGFRAGGV